MIPAIEKHATSSRIKNSKFAIIFSLFLLWRRGFIIVAEKVEVNTMRETISAEKFYYDLQNSRVREHAFNQWEEYRKQVTNLLITACDQGKTLAIFGAGRGNDMDLSRLAGHFREITLIDLNENAMQSAVRQYSLEGHPAIKLEQQDFVGITDEDYIQYLSVMGREYLQMGYVLNDPVSQTFTELERLYEKAGKHRPDFGRKRYDYSLVLNVHSQLNDTADWIRTHMMSLLGEPVDYHNRTAVRILEETALIVKKFNEAVLAATGETTFIGYEIGIQGQPGDGIQGALQTHQDLRKREKCGQIRLKQQDLLTWPYDRKQKIVFTVLLETLSVLL